MLEYAEKRAFTRMDTDCEMTFKYVDSETVYRSTCLNLSGAGVCFITNQDIPVGKAIEISITPANTITPSLEAFVEVTRNSAAEGENDFEIAGSIKGIKGKS